VSQNPGQELTDMLLNTWTQYMTVIAKAKKMLDNTQKFCQKQNRKYSISLVSNICNLGNSAEANHTMLKQVSGRTIRKVRKSICNAFSYMKTD
jgi:hypothetical protein